ncbi:MAG: hypothetical protein J7493_03115 [Porphyrobacter sp.]|nr:hypothetical protein [Porphyrobacter sp.]
MTAISLATPAFRPGRLMALVGLLGLVVLLQIELVFSKSVNWDEFFHFSRIHQQLLDRPIDWLQVPYIYLYSWVPSLPGDSITHIQIIRFLILPFELATIAAIVAAARQFASRESAVLCGLVYVTGGYVFSQGFALRADMIACAFLTVALWISLSKPLRPSVLILVTLLLGLAFLSTIKSVLWAPAFLGAALYRLEKPRQRWTVVAATATIGIAGTLFLLAAPWLPQSGLGGRLHDIGELGRASIDRMFVAELFPLGGYLLKQALMAPILTVTILMTLWLNFARDRDAKERLLALCLLAPLLTVAIYRNAFPYHFGFILPPAIIAAAPAIELLSRRYGALTLGLLLLLNAVILSLVEDRNVLPRQRAVQNGIHQIFSAPVAYIDNSGMASEFPRVRNHFASGWGLEVYREAGIPVYSQEMRIETVPLLITNVVSLQNVFYDTGVDAHLLPQDARTLRENYVPHWGYVYVAGKQIREGSSPLMIEISVPGTYTVEGGPISLEGKTYLPGDTLLLKRGPIRVTQGRNHPVTLRWGDHLPRPSFPWPEERLFTDY